MHHVITVNNASIFYFNTYQNLKLNLDTIIILCNYYNIIFGYDNFLATIIDSEMLPIGV